MQTLQKTIKDLRELSSPLGPFESIESRDRQRANWHAQANDKTLEQLLTLLCNPVDQKEFSPATSDDFHLEIVEALESIGKRSPNDFLKRIEAYLHNSNARLGLIEVIGGLGKQEGIPLLLRLLEYGNLNTNEKIELACSLGEIGGDQAYTALHKMQASPYYQDKEVANEIDIALHSIKKDI